MYHIHHSRPFTSPHRSHMGPPADAAAPSSVVTNLILFMIHSPISMFALSQNSPVCLTLVAFQQVSALKNW